MRRRAYVFGWITTVVAPITELMVLATGHDVASAAIASAAASVVAAEVAIRLFGTGNDDSPPPAGGGKLVRA